MSETINFDELADLHQANVRRAKYHVKRSSAGKFIISNDGKNVIGLDPTKGVNIKYGNGLVLMATLPKEDKRASTVLNGVQGNGFTSSEFERILEDNGILASTYNFKNFADHDGLTYFRLEIKKPLGDVEAMAEVIDESGDEAEEPDTNQQESDLSASDLEAKITNPSDDPVVKKVEDEF